MISRRFLGWSLAALVAGLSPSPSAAGPQAQEPGQGVAISFVPDRLVLSLYQPVILYFTARNTLSEAVTLDLGWNRVGKFVVTILTPNGLTVHPVPRRRGGISRAPEVLLAPGDSYSQELLLNQWYSFDKPGNYRLDVQFVGSLHSDGERVGEGPSQREIPLGISPRNPAVLAKTCHQLATRAVSANAQSALAAAEALGYVVDLVSVPYLGRLTRPGLPVPIVKSIALEGLNRIAAMYGTRPVVSALESQDSGVEPLITGKIHTPTD